MKKIFCLIMLLIFAFSISACKKTSEKVSVVEQHEKNESLETLITEDNDVIDTGQSEVSNSSEISSNKDNGIIDMGQSEVSNSSEISSNRKDNTIKENENVTPEEEIIINEKENKENEESNYIKINSAEDVYALSRVLAFPAAKTFIESTPEYSIEDDFATLGVPENLATKEEKISYLQTASYSLISDIDLTMQQTEDSSYFLGIGSRDVQFKGIFEGNNNTITLSVPENLIRNSWHTNEIGLFGSTTDAKISNLNISISDDMIVEESSTLIAQGVFVGNAVATTFENCSVEIYDCEIGSDFTATGIDPGTYVGGFAGKASRSTFKDCTVTLKDASIVAKGGDLSSQQSTVYSQRSAGGFIGFSNPGSSNTDNIGRLGNQLFNCKVISNNSTQRDVIVASIEKGQEVTAGGLIGCSFNNLLVKNCSVEMTKANIIAKKDSLSDDGFYYGSQAGGIIGRLEHTGELNGCEVTGDYLNIFAKSGNNITNAGGIVGIDVGPWHRDIITINNCHFNGSNTSNIEVKITSTDIDDVRKTVAVGGIVGSGTYKIANCSAKDVKIINNSPEIENKACVGGIAGYMQDAGYWAQWGLGTYFKPGTPGITGCSTAGITFGISANVIITNE